MKIPVVGPSYQMDALSYDVQRSINLYPLISEVQTSKDVVALRKCPGYKLYTTAGGGPIRGEIVVSGRAFVVSGFELYEIFADKSSTLRGTLNTGSQTLSIAENGSQIIIVDGVNGYTFELSSNIFAEISDPDFPNGTTIVRFMDGYFIVNKPGGAAFAISGINDGSSWDALDFAVASSNPDDLISLIADRGNLWLFGNISTEVYLNTGAASFPFERIDGAVIQTGCEAPHTVQKVDNTIVWLGVDEQGRGVVWKADGYNAVRISTQAIERKIAESDIREASYAWVYHQQGHVFYCLQVRGLDTTLVYDFAVQQWHERSFQNSALNQKEQHRGSCHFFFDNKNLIGDRESGNIYELSLELYDDNGEEMVWERITPHFDEEKRMISHSALELDCEVGRGLVSGQGSDPQIMMCYSDDGGRTWSDELWRSLGKLGEYSTRVIWHRLGSSRDRVYKFRGSDPVFFQLNEAYLNGA